MTTGSYARMEDDMGLRALRVSRGLTLEQVAVLAQIDKAAISRYERGLTGLGPWAIVNLSKALKVSPDLITNGNGE